jgi:hypothetical protein
MKISPQLVRLTLALALSMAVQQVRAEDQCIEFAWDVRAEHLLFAMHPKVIAAGADRAGTPAVSLDQLYQLHLQKQTDVKFPTPPGAREAKPDGYGGLAQLQVAVAGAYRISADQPLWIDVAFNGALLKPQDFQGRRGCNAPHKIVEFVLPMGVQLTLQISNAANADVKISITPSPEAAH